MIEFVAGDRSERRSSPVLRLPTCSICATVRYPYSYWKSRKPVGFLSQEHNGAVLFRHRDCFGVCPYLSVV